MSETTLAENAGRRLKARAWRDLSKARLRRAFPPVRVSALQILEALEIKGATLKEIAERADYGSTMGDLREEIEALAAALILYSPHTVRIRRARARREGRGGSTAYTYRLFLAPR